MKRELKIGDRYIGDGHPTYIIGEIGINHNGDMDIAKELISKAKEAGCDAVKFQKRTPELCVPVEQRNVMRETPWGIMSYMDYRERVEFGYDEYKEIDRFCKEKDIHWFVSCWDEDSVDFIEQFNPVCHKVASASITDESFLKKLNKTGKPILLSSGMSTIDEIKKAVSLIDKDKLAIAHSTSTYPCKPEELNLKMIHTLKDEYEGVPVGYSGHEVGLQTTVAAVVMGACFVERHITLDRSMWGSDQSASVEPQGLERLCRDIRVIEKAIGDGVKKVYESELPAKARLRKIG